MSVEMLLIFALAALLIGLSKGGLGGPVSGALALPLMTLVMPVSKAAGVMLPLLIVGDMFAVYFYRGKWSMHYIRLLLPAAVIGILFGTLLLTRLSDEALRVILGIFMLVLIVYKLVSDRIRSLEYVPYDWHGYLAGWVSGFASALANVGGPPFSVYMLLQPKMTPVTFSATAALFFATLNVLKLPAFLTSGVMDVQYFLSIAWIIPIIPLAVWLGRKSVSYFNPKVFERTLLALLFILSLTLIF
jgi:uncharacterized protein